MDNFENKIQALRESKGWSKTYVANHIGIKMQTYANYEYGRRQPDFETLSKIANLYSVTTDYLLGRETPPNDKHALTVKEALDSVMSSDGKGIREADKPILEAIISKYLAEAK